MTVRRASAESPPGPCAVTVILFLPGASGAVNFHAVVPLAVFAGLRPIWMVTLVTAPAALPLIASLALVVVTFFFPLMATVGGAARGGSGGVATIGVSRKAWTLP